MGALIFLFIFSLSLEESIALITFVGSLITLLIPSWRKNLARLWKAIKNHFARNRIEWQNELLSELQKTRNTHKQIVDELKEAAPKWTSGANIAVKLADAVFDSENGIEVRLAKTEISADEQFRDLPYPAFQCLPDGTNIIVSDAYCDIVNLPRGTDLNSLQWKNHTVLSDENKDYFSNFLSASGRGDDYIGIVEFQDPVTNEKRGKWRTFCKAYNLTDSDIIYRGRFTCAIDDKAKSLVDEHKWKVYKAH